MPNTSAPDDEALQRICEEVAVSHFFDLSPGSITAKALADSIEEYAKAVARRYAATVGVGVPEEVRKAFEGVDIGPLAYRPQEFDDWGVIRQANATGDDWHPVVASVRVRDDEDEQNAARREKREPRSIAALGPAIVAAFNWALSVAGPAHREEAMQQDAVRAAHEMLERRAAETRGDADARRDKLRRAMTGPGKQFQGSRHEKPHRG